MHARIYFLLVLAGLVIVAFKNEKIAELTAENGALKGSLEEQQIAARSTDESVSSYPLNSPSGYSPIGWESATAPPLLPHNLEKPAEIQEKIRLMEEQLRRYRNEALGYQMMIGALKDEISIKETELHEFRIHIARYHTENQSLMARLTEKETDLKNTIESARNGAYHSAQLERRLDELGKNLRVAEADACHARAELTEVAGRRIFFSRARKNQYLMEALEGYRKAFALGKKEAYEDMTRLEKSLRTAVAFAP